MAELLPKIDRWTWKLEDSFPKLVEPEHYASYSPLTGYILRKIFGEASLYKARTFKGMCEILESTFPALGDIPATPYISRATIAYVHCIILHTPYYSRDDKNIKGKVEDYYRREMEIFEEITDEDFKEGVHAMFKHHYNWIAKDVGAGYNPDADMYVDPPSSPTPPATPQQRQSAPARAKAMPQPAAGEAEAGAVACADAGEAGEEPGAADTTAVDEQATKGKGGPGKRGGNGK